MKANKIQRSAGILMHITSLPGNYGIGDFGPEAFQFADMLKQAGQRYWQLLPLNPVEENKGCSPYSPLSAFAGNTLFINPEQLVHQKYLKSLPEISHIDSTNQADYHSAMEIKKSVIEASYEYYYNQSDKRVDKEFHHFCEKESFWLEDYALFILLKRKFGKPWFEWPAELRDRIPNAIQTAVKEHDPEITREKYAQFLFTRQWHVLKAYCNKLDIQIIGDIPIYTSHDSADVWANPQYWKLDRKKQMAKIAGVPPDYFNEKGQLWNMPVYDWNLLKKEKYRWWIQRLIKNLELFDIVRLDHFRGFSTYWEVKGGSKDAIHGKWRKGPAEDFFDIVQKAFPGMPFIAEDLGDVDQVVYDLCDKYKLPGMRILQFAFEGNIPKSIFIPHNYTENSVVYTGTHDNNTVKGWYKHEVSREGKKNLNRYLGIKTTPKNCYKALIREAYKSIARMAIVPMQDILGLGGKNRMNFPSTETGNWLWRMKKKQCKKKHIDRLAKWTEVYGRFYSV